MGNEVRHISAYDMVSSSGDRLNSDKPILMLTCVRAGNTLHLVHILCKINIFIIMYQLISEQMVQVLLWYSSVTTVKIYE